MTVLFVIATIIVFLTFDVFVRRSMEKKALALQPIAKQPSMHTNHVRIPE